MASFAPIRGTRAQIQATPVVDGQFLVETDQGDNNKIYIDEGSTRTIVGGNIVGGVLPELYIYSEAGSTVTVEDEEQTIIPTSQVGSDHWICEVPDYGVYTIKSVLNGETVTQSVNVTDCMIYTIDASHFHVNVVVTYPSGVGANCQISGGGETYSAPALNPPDTSYKFVVHGKNTTYTITTNIDGGTKTATVTTGTTLDQTYNVEMLYGKINLTVVTPPITGTLTCTDGVSTVTKPVSENVLLYVPNTGTWTISGTDGTDTFYVDVAVTDYTTVFTATLNAVNGSTAIPTDDIQIWLHCAGIYDKTEYTTLADVLADHETLYLLMGSNNAVNYLVRSTTWVSDITADEYAMKYIGKWNYASDTLLNNSMWLTGICGSAHFEYVLNGSVPKMTSDDAPSGHVTGTTPASGSQLYYAFDKDDSTVFRTASQTTAEIKYEFTEAIEIRKFDWAVIYGDTTTTLSLQLMYSDDGTNYTNAGSAYSYVASPTSTTQSYVIATQYGKHKYWGIKRTATTTFAGVARTVQFYGRQDVTENLIDIYSAADDRVYYIENGEEKTVCTTDLSGHYAVAKSLLPNGTYTLISTKANDPSNLSNPYTKTITITDGTSEIRVMPEGAVYWYGWSIGDFAAYAYKPTGGTETAKAPTLAKNTNDFTSTQTYVQTYSAGSIIFSTQLDLTGYTAYKAIAKDNHATSSSFYLINAIQNNYSTVSVAAKNSTNDTFEVLTSAINDGATQGYAALWHARYGGNATDIVTVKALWLE